MPTYTSVSSSSCMAEKDWKVVPGNFMIKPIKLHNGTDPSNVILSCTLALLGFLPKLALHNWTEKEPAYRALLSRIECLSI